MKIKIIFFILLSLHFAFAKERENKVSFKKSGDSLVVQTYYEEDEDELISYQGTEGEVDIPIKKLYGAKIRISPISERRFKVNYFGPLYAQCGVGRCEVQGYTFEIDQCGIISNLANERTGLKRYAPNKREGNFHTQITDDALDRIQFYANNKEITSLFYKDLAGDDKKSNYVLGNTVEASSSTSISRDSRFLRDDVYKGGGSRWLLNPWSTNTVATFFIHLDMIRESMKSLSKDSCNDWPRFQGQTPIPQEKVDPYGIPFPDNYIGYTIYDYNLIKARVENEKIEIDINDIANKCEGLEVVGPHRIGYKNSSVQNLANDIESVLSRLDKSVLPENYLSIENIRSDLEKYQGTSLIYQYRELKIKLDRIELAQKLRDKYFEVWKDERLTSSEAKELFNMFQNFNSLKYSPLFHSSSQGFSNIDDVTLQEFHRVKMEDLEGFDKLDEESVKNLNFFYNRIKSDWAKFMSN